MSTLLLNSSHQFGHKLNNKSWMRVSHRSFISKADDGQQIKKLSSKNITLLSSYEVMAKSLNRLGLFPPFSFSFSFSFSIFHSSQFVWPFG